MRWASLVLGGLMVIAGGTWTLQGIGILPGSFMTGQAFWAVAGLLMLAAGGVLGYAGTRPNARRRR